MHHVRTHARARTHDGCAAVTRDTLRREARDGQPVARQLPVLSPDALPYLLPERLWDGHVVPLDLEPDVLHVQLGETGGYRVNGGV